MHATYEAEAVESAISIRRIFVAIELSKSTWVVAIQPPAVDKVSLFRIPGGDIEKLFVLLDQAQDRCGGADKICACYEAGYDGFWIHRALTARGVISTVLDSASIQVSRAKGIARGWLRRSRRVSKPGLGRRRSPSTPARQASSGKHHNASQRPGRRPPRFHPRACG